MALAPFLHSCPEVVTLGIRAAVGDYSEEERSLLRRADRVFFPTPRFINVFYALGKPTFPGAATYQYQRSRVLQQLLFQYLKWPHPRSRIYFGTKPKKRILEDFELPVLAMGPRVASRTVHSICDSRELEYYVGRYNPLIIQEKVHWVERIRLLCVCCECVGAHRLFLTESGEEYSEPLPLACRDLRDPVERTLSLLRIVCLDDMVIEWGYGNEAWQLLGMTRPPMQWHASPGMLHRHDYICERIRSGLL